MRLGALLLLLIPAVVGAQEATVAPVVTPLPALPSIARSWTARGGHAELLGWVSRVQIRLEGEELVLEAHAQGRTFVARGPKQPDADGFYAFEATLVSRTGAIGRLIGLGQGPPARARVLLRENAATGRFHGQELLDGKLVGRPQLVRRKRVLIGYSSVREYEQALWLQNYSTRTALYYVMKGYEVRREKLENIEELIAELEAARDDPYDRVVTISHAATDGPVLGWGNRAYEKDAPLGARQTAPPSRKEHPELWPGLVAAVKAGTTQGAILFASGCNTATGAWVTTLARETGRTVVGPNAYTAWWKTPTHARVLEGEAEALQPLVWAQGESVRVIPEGAPLAGTIPAEELRRVDLALGDPAPHPDSGLRGFVMRTTEEARSEAVMELVRGWGPIIDQHAASRAQADLMRAIVFEEQVHQNPPGLEALGEAAGLGDTVGPSQIHVALWGPAYGVTRAELRDPEVHFRVMRQHLDKVAEQARLAGLGDSPAALGSVWNNMKAKQVTAYGKRVERFYLLFAQRK